MEFLLLSDIVNIYQLDETKVYTKLQQLKQEQSDLYLKYISQNAFNELQVDISLIDEFIHLFEENHDEVESSMVNFLQTELEKSEARYNRLLADYVQLTKQMQSINQQLLIVTTQQQELIKDQIAAVVARDPRHLARKITQLEEREIEMRLEREEREERQSVESDLYQLRNRRRRS